MTKLNGEQTAQKLRKSLQREINQLEQKGVVPTIAPILVGSDPGAKIYYRQKKKIAKQLGINYSGVKLDESIDRQELLDHIDELNEDPNIHGLFVELPLPGDLSIEKINNNIDPRKDIDCIHPVNLGKLVAGGAARHSYEELREDPEMLLPATPHGVMELLDAYDIELEGKNVVIVGGGANGLPLSLLMLRQGYSTVTICEYKANDLPEQTKSADILVSAVGKANFITQEMVSEGAVVVDIGINQTESGITGDVAYEEVAEKASFITPVPGGVGPMTTTMIMSNTVHAASAAVE